MTLFRLHALCNSDFDALVSCIAHRPCVCLLFLGSCTSASTQPCFEAAVCLDRDDLFYPVYAYLLPILILRLPYSIAICLLFNAIVYFSIGLSLSAGR